ncbi:hypothetical protein [Paraburkholderia lycopersici]|uniref:hypothetical protein n=1 Tax=Paraburkholderia lycopersici TaxID=416944 RepID=UPI0011613CBF|nr:hypothetical protein [Paraburkholderia lycopersici]
MSNLDDLLKKYNADLTRFRGLNIVSMPVSCSNKLDIGFSRKENRRLGAILPKFARKQIASGLYVFGADVDRWHSQLTKDEELCAALRLLLSYAYRIEWAGSSVTARVNNMAVNITGDASRGDLFLATLSNVSKRLAIFCNDEKVLMNSSGGSSWGPATIRKVLLFASFVAPLVLLLVFHYLTSNLRAR